MSYSHFTLQERFDIKHLKVSVSLREIGRRLGRSHTSITPCVRIAVASP